MENEKRLIDANDVYALFGANGMARLHVGHIDVLPRVDAVEVVHGHWSFIGEECCVCSVCHKHAIVDYRFCPECGAKMDGDGNG